MIADKKTVEVVLAVIMNKNYQLLVTKRQKSKFMPDYWELPGGKVEQNETKLKALVRELKEEIDINLSDANLIHQMEHEYSKYKVKLWIYKVNDFDGYVKNAEGQELLWSSIKDLNNLSLLPTMRAIVNKITMPDKYWITPAIDNISLLTELAIRVNKVKMVQLRNKNYIDDLFLSNFYKICKQSNITLILNNNNKTFAEDCDGWHLTAKELFCFTQRPCAKNKILGVSTHCVEEIEKAYSIDADYISISPINETSSHLEFNAIGWDMAEQLVKKSNLPAYLLGGMSVKDIDRALFIGAQGIAGISNL